MMLVALESRSGWLVVWGWQVSQRPLAACKGEWEDKYLSWVMAWRSVPVSGLRFNAQMEVLNRLFSLSFPFTCVMCCSIMPPASCAAQSCYRRMPAAIMVIHAQCVCLYSYTHRKAHLPWTLHLLTGTAAVQSPCVCVCAICFHCDPPRPATLSTDINTMTTDWHYTVHNTYKFLILNFPDTCKYSNSQFISILYHKWQSYLPQSQTQP